MIRKIVDQGSCVIVDRVADYVLRNYNETINIFIYAPKDYCIKKVMEVYGDSKEEAKKNIHRSDETRAVHLNSLSKIAYNNIFAVIIIAVHDSR